MDIPVKQQRSFAWRAAVWVGLIAVLAAAGLFGLRTWHSRAVHAVAAQAVAERGQWLAMNLALRAAGAAAREGEAGAWQEFSGLVRSLREMESDLEYVSVRRRGVTLFREHADGAGAVGDEAGYRFEGPVALGRQKLRAGTGEVSVVTFTVGVAGRDEEPVRLELGMRRRAVEREEWAAMSAVDSMYRLSLVTLAGCFGVCLVLVAGMVRREERRERARRREEHLAFSGMLANGIVHDFRNPMSSLRLDAQMLGKEMTRDGGPRTGRAAELAERMRHTLDRMDKVFEEFLTLARPGEAAAGPVDLRAGVEDCLRMLAPRFEAAGVTPEVAGESPLECRASAPAVKRALLNLLLNALQHAGRGGRVRVDLARAGSRVRVEVSDTGPGIPPADRERVFEMFYTTRPQGTGLGLFLARTAVENQGGTLTAAEPAAGEGARLRMELPPARKEDA